MKEQTELPVLIAGGGPVGVTLAMDLASRGIKSIVLESRLDIPPNPRCNTTNARSMEIFRRLGCADAVRHAGLPADSCTDVVYMTRLNGAEMLRYERPTPAQVFAGTAWGVGSGWPTPEHQHFISQIYLEPVLRQHAASHFGVEIRQGWELVDFEQDEDGVAARARDCATGEMQTMRSRYLVGADGAASKTRRRIGGRLEGIAEIRNSCSVFVRSKRLLELYQQHPGWMYRFPFNVNLVAIDGKELWLFHTHMPPGTNPDDFNPKPSMFGAIGEAFDYEVVNVTRWTSRAMVANKWRQGRVFLAGDAAHIWIPMGGFGMNAGIGDAASLGWMLAGVMQGWLDPKLLDAYEAERASLGARVASQANRWGADLRPLLRLEPEAVADLENNRMALEDLGARIDAVNRTEWESCGMQLGATYENSPIIAHDGTPAPAFELDSYRETSWPGARAPHIWRDGKPGLALFDQFGPGFTLLRMGSTPPAAQALQDAAAARHVPLTVLDVPEQEAFAKYEGYALVLIRPDQHVVWRSRTDPGAAEASALLQRITGALVPQTNVASLPAELLGTELQSIPTVVKAGLNGAALLPDGRLVVASAQDAQLLAGSDGNMQPYASLDALQPGELGPLCVDSEGRVYVLDLGSATNPAAARVGRLIRVATNGGAQVIASGLSSPGSVALIPGSPMLLITDNSGITQYRIGQQGALREPQPLVQLRAGFIPRGMAASAAQGVWVCVRGAVENYDAAGRLKARVGFTQGDPLACTLAADGQTLYVRGVTGRPAESDWLYRIDVAHHKSRAPAQAVAA